MNTRARLVVTLVGALCAADGAAAADATSKLVGVIDPTLLFIASAGASGEVYPYLLIGVQSADAADCPDRFGPVDGRAVAFLQGLVGRNVMLSGEAGPDDGMGRCAVPIYVHLEDGTSVNAELIKRGLARVDATLPFRLLDDYRTYEARAREARMGVWGSFFEETAGTSRPSAGRCLPEGSERAVCRYEGGSRPELIAKSYVMPRYPAQARKAGPKGAQARAVLQVVVLSNGKVGDIRPLPSLGPEYGFAEAAIDAVKKWRYKPSMKDGKPVAAYTPVVVDFTLHEAPKPSGLKQREFDLSR